MSATIHVAGPIFLQYSLYTNTLVARVRSLVRIDGFEFTLATNLIKDDYKLKYHLQYC